MPPTPTPPWRLGLLASGGGLTGRTRLVRQDEDWNAVYAAATDATHFIHEAGTKTLTEELELPGLHTYDYRASIIRQGDDAGLDHLAATPSYNANSAFVDEPLTIIGGLWNCNLAGNGTATTSGIIVRAYRSTLWDVQVIDPMGDGIVFSAESADDTTPTGTMVECAAYNCKVFAENNTTGACFRLKDDDATAKVTDGYLVSCLAFGGAHSLLAEQSAGWHLDGFHGYACSSHGLYIFNPSATRISDLYLEGYGMGESWRVGVWLSGVGARGVTLMGGTIHSVDHEDGTSIGVLCAGAGGVDATAIIATTIEGTDSGDVTDNGMVLEGGSGGTLVVNISGSVIVGCDTDVQVSGTVTSQVPVLP